MEEHGAVMLVPTLVYFSNDSVAFNLHLLRKKLTKQRVFRRRPWLRWVFFGAFRPMMVVTVVGNYVMTLILASLLISLTSSKLLELGSSLQYMGVCILYIMSWVLVTLKEVDKDCRPIAKKYLEEAISLQSLYAKDMERGKRLVSKKVWDNEVAEMDLDVENAENDYATLCGWCGIR